MAAVIRIKRRLEDEPSETLILNCKKRKIDSVNKDDESQLSAVLKFAGTIKNQEDIYAHLKKPSKIELKDQFKKHNTDVSAKLRIQRQQDSKKSRYKVVHCFRSPTSNVDEAAAELLKSEYTIYDLETAAQENQPSSSDNETKYVYDLYYTTSDDLGDACFPEYVDMYPYNDPLMFGSMRDNGVNKLDSDDDSEDSNAEGNWKNDYPDESDMESVTEDDMLKAVKHININDLSSDDGEEGFIYSVDSESAGFEEDVDDGDVQRYGERYARFKARHKKGIETSVVNSDLYYGDIDEEEYYY